MLVIETLMARNARTLTNVQMGHITVVYMQSATIQRELTNVVVMKDTLAMVLFVVIKMNAQQKKITVVRMLVVLTLAVDSPVNATVAL